MHVSTCDLTLSSYPSQANKAVKMTPRIPPKNGSSFQPGQIIRLEFPAQGYVNPLNTKMQFDVVLFGPTNPGAYAVRIQNNIQSLFNRVRLLYGASPQEDLLQYNVLVRCLTEWTCTRQGADMDQTSIADGIAGVVQGFQASMNTDNTPSSVAWDARVNGRQAYIQGIEGGFVGAPNSKETTNGVGLGVVPNNSQPATLPGGIAPNGVYSVRRYMVNFALGVFTQDKLIPTKYMASQLAIEITLEQAAACLYQPVGVEANTAPPTYAIGNINLIPEIIEFDDTYDEQFLRGLETGGVPIKFSTWHYFQFTTQGSSSLQLQITERSRSVKGLFAIQRRQPVGLQYDSHACLFDSSTLTSSSTGSTMQQYQFRIGGRYFPAAPVQLSANVGSSICNGGAEAYVELEKLLNIVGDYRLSTNTTCLNWAIPAITTSSTVIYPEYDYSYAIAGYSPVGVPDYLKLEATTSCVAGNAPSCMYACAINFETSNGIEISGLNAEEQSDISFNVMWSSGQATGFSIEVMSYVDVMWVLRPNNYLDLIQ